jgi:hypothetical protein
MPFDPEIPQPDDDLDAEAMRAQLNGLKDLIDALTAQAESLGNTLVAVQAQVATFPPDPASQSGLMTEIAATARNPVVGPFGSGFSDPPTQGEMQAFATWVESLRESLWRTP